VLGWAFGACLFTALAFGFAPALFALRLDLFSTLKSGGRGTTGSRGHQRFRSSSSSASSPSHGPARGRRPLRARDPRLEPPPTWLGIRPPHHRHLLLPTATYPGGQEMAAFQRLARERLEALPGVASASTSYAMPFFGLGESRKFRVAGREASSTRLEPVAVVKRHQPALFETVGTRMESGRAFQRERHHDVTEGLRDQRSHGPRSLRRSEPTRPAHRPGWRQEPRMGRDRRRGRRRPIALPMRSP